MSKLKHKAGLALFVVVIVLIAYNISVLRDLNDFTEKVWLHRTNSLEKMEEKENRFPNFEVDLVFRNNGVFDVTHNADTSFNLRIDRYLADIAQDDDRMWMDIKNLNKQNAPCMLQTLDSLCHRYQVDKNQLIIESKNLNALSLFTRAGYYTSYYVDYDKPSRLSDAEIEKCIAHLQRVADSDKVEALSFPGWWYDEISDHLHRNIDLLTWKHRTTKFGLLALPSNREILEDPQVKVILVKSKGKYHR